MRLEINQDQLIEELEKNTTKIAADVQKVIGTKFTDELCSEACHHIKAYLTMHSSLPVKGGLQQFYDTQSDLAKKAAGWRIPKNTDDPHLIDMWKVDYAVGDHGDFAIIISNDKRVRGKTQSYHLFDLLWNGTGYYVVPMKLTFEQGQRLANMSRVMGSDINEMRRARLAEQPLMQMSSRIRKKGNPNIRQGKGEKIRVSYSEKTRRQVAAITAGFVAYGKKAMGKVRDVTGFKRSGISGETPGSMDRATKIRADVKFAGKKYKSNVTYVEDVSTEHQPGKAMHFYNRFAGKFYTNQYFRKGIEEPIVQDFHDYVSNCVYKGIMDAAGLMNNMEFDKYEIEREMYYS